MPHRNKQVAGGKTRTNPASQVERKLLSPQVELLLHAQMPIRFSEYIAGSVIDAIGGDEVNGVQKHSFTDFVSRVLHRAQVRMSLVVTVVLYIDRAKPRLAAAADNRSLEEVFAGAVVVASKYLNDCTYKNHHWSRITGIFSVRQLGVIERQFLHVIDWKLRVSEEDICSMYDSFAGPLCLPASTELRKS
ncbi:hypothetical protein GYMLUDRAFT_253087 [Collybiopsis luxurians FD-317 M1]|uniref:Cyclin-like domain-containing protein n=1 Tax=Collybiopsis luxurians FD-317 M1 TaxID=944289 RepID=A0A0D0BXW6_9AGAR|nr:hypothetical protein GYMLUDRAFT_253087 [Collybiopsis luxurians FD-317 M1]